jgi:hypothetical protein
MPYIPPQNRPAIDAAVERLAAEMAEALARDGQTAELSELYRDAFNCIADAIARLERGGAADASAPERLAGAIVEAARGYRTKGGWLGELNYGLTMLIQRVPLKMKQSGAWEEALRYWIYAETVGALVRTSYDVHARYPNTWIGNGLAGVFEDVKDEYKRRVNTAYEAAQILKSGDCYDAIPYRTRLVPFEHAGVRGHIEIMLPKAEASCGQS